MTREEIIKWLESLKAEMGKSEHSTLWHYAEAIDMAIEALTDAVEVVRCEDCKYSKHLKQYPKVNTWKCTLTDVVYRADDYCRYGERKNED